MKSRPLLAPILLFLGGFLVCWIYQAPPSLGDDLNYWGLAFDLHHGVPDAWSPGSFHDLRWPVWGLCWLLQIPFGFSALSYYLEPMIYLGASAAIVYLLAREVGATEPIAFLAGILLLFHPQLDSLMNRPMPDLSEGFWVSLAFLAWLKMVRTERITAKVPLVALVGLALAVAQANRITGVFAVPVLVIATLAFYPRQVLWLGLCGLFAAGFVFIEAAIYHSLTGDWLHSLHANLGARGRKGTESLSLWKLPFRFLPSLFDRPSAIALNLTALLGIGVAWRTFGPPGRALVLYAIGYLLIYSCALQSLSPPRPLMRDGDRFLGSLAFPLSILSALALAWLVGRLPRPLRAWPPARWIGRRPALALAAVAVALAFLADRPFRGPNYLHEIAVCERSAPPGLRVLSHAPMRHVAYLADPAAAERVDWILQNDLLDPSPMTRQLAATADEIWFNRKWIWTGTRKKSEYDQLSAIGEIAPYLRPPLGGWSARSVILKDDAPDFVFLARRKAGARLSEQCSTGRLLRTELLPELPVPHTWDFSKPKHDAIELPPRPLPALLAGRTLFLSLRYSSDATEPIRAAAAFLHRGVRIQDLSLTPYFFGESSEDFFFITIPPEADAVQVRFRISPKAGRVALDSFRLFVDGPATR
ncbi:MAG: hypothetical protein PHC88_04355 [Terrimicrobiaceae bacterium]|nr:hypothetical protein [Terrimicrobiaceae bacterium]